MNFTFSQHVRDYQYQIHEEVLTWNICMTHYYAAIMYHLISTIILQGYNTTHTCADMENSYNSLI